MEWKSNPSATFRKKMRFILLIMIFLLLSGLFIISNNNLSFKDMTNVDIFYKIYSDWIGKIVGNTITITGNAVKLEWAPQTKK